MSGPLQCSGVLQAMTWSTNFYESSIEQCALPRDSHGIPWPSHCQDSRTSPAMPPVVHFWGKRGTRLLRLKDCWCGEADGQACPKGAQAIWRKKDDDVYPSLILCHSEKTPLLSETQDEGFLAKDPASWEEDDQFKDARKRALGFWVVNNAVEQSIALVQHYLGSKKSAAQKYLLHLLHHHQKHVGRKEEEDLQKKAFWMETLKTVCFGFLIIFFSKIVECFQLFLCFLKDIRRLFNLSWRRNTLWISSNFTETFLMHVWTEAQHEQVKKLV